MSHLDPRLDPNQMAAMRAQMQQIEFNQHMQQQSLMTQQSQLALDAAKYIVDHRHVGEDPKETIYFSDEEIHNAYDVIATIAKVFRPMVQPPPIPEGMAKA